MSLVFAEELLRFFFALGTFTLARWMLELSTPEQDWKELQAMWQDIMWLVKRGKWYVGHDLTHQIRAWNLWRESYGNL